MGKYNAQAAFDQLAIDLKEKVAGVLLKTEIPQEEQQKEMNEVNRIIENWRKEHDFALDTYYGIDRTRSIKSALKNDLKERR